MDVNNKNLHPGSSPFDTLNIKLRGVLLEKFLGKEHKVLVSSAPWGWDEKLRSLTTWLQVDKFHDVSVSMLPAKIFGRS